MSSEANKIVRKFCSGGALPPQPPVGALPQTPFWVRLHEYFSCSIIHLIIILNNTLSVVRGAYFMHFFFGLGRGGGD